MGSETPHSYRGKPLPPHYRKPRHYSLPLIHDADAAEIKDSAVTHVPSHQSTGSPIFQQLVAVEMCPQFASPPAEPLAETDINVGGDADETIPGRVETEKMTVRLRPTGEKRPFDLPP